MTDDARDIPPALGPTQWLLRGADFGDLSLAIEGETLDEERAILQAGSIGGRRLHLTLRLRDDRTFATGHVAYLAALIALANAAMNDEDPRKLTREHVAALRARIQAWGDESIAGYEELGDVGVSGDNPALAAEARQIDLLRDLADVIESYLPPASD